MADYDDPESFEPIELMPLLFSVQERALDPATGSEELRNHIIRLAELLESTDRIIKGYKKMNEENEAIIDNLTEQNALLQEALDVAKAAIERAMIRHGY